MNGFKETELAAAYKMIKGNVCLIATKGNTERLYNLTPIAWFMAMDYEPVTKFIFSCDPSHQCRKNIERTKEFAVCFPTNEEDEYINSCGSVSSADIDKFSKFNIPYVKAVKTNLHIPAEFSRGWIECRLIKIQREGSIDLIMGEAAAAFERE